MTETKRREVTLGILKQKKTLDAAEKALTFAIDPLPSKAWAWGVFDGYHGRPETASGLIAECLLDTPDARKIEREYKAACSLGRDLATCELPR